MRKKVSWLIITLLVSFLSYQLTINYEPITVHAACDASTRAEGLISAKNITGKFGTTTGTCVTGDVSSFISFKVPTFEDLKSLYFDQGKSSLQATHTGDLGEGTLRNNYLMAASPKTLVYVTGNLVISGNIAGTNTGIVFVQGNLTFGNGFSQFTYGSGNSGLVFVVKGDIIIPSNITRIDAVLINSGILYTAGNNCNKSEVVVTSALTINGSIISLNPTNGPRFCRTFQNNNTGGAAEIINHQPKYLVILKDLFGGSLQYWKELASPPTGTATGFDYNITNTGGPVSVTRGQSSSAIQVNLTLTASATNTQSISLSVSGLPDGVTTDFSPAPANCFAPCTKTLRIDTTTSAELVTNRTITVTGAPLAKATTFSLTINPAVPIVTTDTVDDNTITTTTATLKGTVNPNGLSTAARFKWGSSNTSCADLPNETTSQIFTGSTNNTYTQNITGLSPGTEYFYCAYATNNDGPATGVVRSFYSSRSCAVQTVGDPLTISPSTCITTPSAPTAPTLNTPVVASSTQINLSWNSVPGATSYKVFRCQGATCTSFSQITIPPITSFSYNSAGLTCNTTYRFKVIASNSVGDSGDSNIQSATTSACQLIFDAASSGQDGSGVGTTSASWTHAVGSGNNRLLLVGVSVTQNAGNPLRTVTSVTYSSTPLQKVTNGSIANGTNNDVELWYLLQPQSGASTIKVNISGAGIISGGATSWSNVNQITPFGTVARATGNSTTPSVTATSIAGEFVVDTIAAGSTGVSSSVTGTVGSNQTQRWNIVQTCGSCAKVRGLGSTELGSPSTVMNWTLSSAVPWSAIAVPIRPI